VGAGARARAGIVQKQAGVLFGLDAAAEAFAQAGAESFDRLVGEGEWLDEVPAEAAVVTGPARALLGAERTALNFLCHLSGIATLTARFVALARPHDVAILDTRKTTPGLRALEKGAVAAGGGRNHRRGLDDAVLIKENHIALGGGVGPAVAAARKARPELEVEVECRTLAEVDEALAAGADRLLLDNMNAAELRAAVAARDGAGSETRLEASGGVTLDNVAEIAATGVGMISVGALTHSAPALDLSLLVEPA
jgi:nicotinate-nucleotide pyrophosphorylase (carboxylating)